MQYYVLLNGEQKGPYTVRQLRAMWHAGTLTAPDQYWQDGMAEWLPLGSILHVLEPPEPTPPPPRPTTAADADPVPLVPDDDASTRGAGPGGWMLGGAASFALGFAAAVLVHPLLPGGRAADAAGGTAISTQAAVAPAPAAADDNSPGYTGDADAFFRAYRANEYAADRRYKGKPATVTGMVKDTGRDVLDSPFVVLGGAGPKEGAQCVFTRGDAAAAALAVGTRVTVRGTVRGRLGRVLLGDCTLLAPMPGTPGPAPENAPQTPPE